MTKNMLQMKKQGKKSQDLINEKEIGNIYLIIVKKFQNIENRMEKIQEKFNTFTKAQKE